jgi:hypothetical protein
MLYPSDTFREADGALTFRKGYLSKDEDIHLGFLSYTQENVASQAFKMLHQPYSWGEKMISKTLNFYDPEEGKEYFMRDVRITKRYENDQAIFSVNAFSDEGELNIEWAVKSLNLEVQDINCYGQKGLTNIFGRDLDSSVEKCRRIWPGQLKVSSYANSKGE